jgi:hypothetical protein
MPRKNPRARIAARLMPELCKRMRERCWGVILIPFGLGITA